MNTATVTHASPFATRNIPADMYRNDVWGSGLTFAQWVGRGDVVAVSILAEAHWFDVLRDAQLENLKRENRIPAEEVPVELSAHERDVEAARRQAEALGATFAQREKLRQIVTERRDAQTALREANERAERLAVELRVLRNEQITDGSDPRLTDFWQTAMDKATEENYCGEYDRMAEMLGGTRRNRTFNVQTLVTIMINVPVQANSEDDAIEIVDDYDHTEMERLVGGLSYYDVNVEEVDGREASEA